MLTTSDPGTEPTCVLGNVCFERKADVGVLYKNSVCVVLH